MLASCLLIVICNRADSCKKRPKTCFVSVNCVLSPRRLVYKKAKDLREMPFTGMLATYSGGGFVMSLPDDKQSIEALFDVDKSGWITNETRAIFIDFVTYNGNMNLFCFVR